MKNLAELAKKNRNQQQKDSRRKAILIVILALIVVLTAVAIVFAVTYLKKNEPEPVYYEPTADTSTDPVPVDPDSEVTVLYLRSGNYIAGVDIPSGTYDLEVICGNGYVYSDNYGFGSISQSMGLYDSSYKSTFHNMVLEDGNIFSINGPTLKLTSADASKEELPGREPWSEEGYVLTSGNYKVGRDFEPGVYDIFYDEGYGYFDTSNSYEGGCANSFGTDDDWSIQVFYHCDLPEGTEISVSELQVTLYPSGLVPVDYYTPIEP